MSSLYGKVSYGADNFNNYGSNKYLEGTKEFLQSNSIVAKIAFLILVVFIFSYYSFTFRNNNFIIYICFFTKSYFNRWYG